MLLLLHLLHPYYVLVRGSPPVASTQGSLAIGPGVAARGHRGPGRCSNGAAETDMLLMSIAGRGQARPQNLVVVP